MLYAQLSGRKSLRDLIFSLNARLISFTTWAAPMLNAPPWRMPTNNVLPRFFKRSITSCWQNYMPKWPIINKLIRRSRASTPPPLISAPPPSPWPRSGSAKQLSSPISYLPTCRPGASFSQTAKTMISPWRKKCTSTVTIYFFIAMNSKKVVSPKKLFSLIIGWPPGVIDVISSPQFSKILLISIPL
jgi:hypothetical protein